MMGPNVKSLVIRKMSYGAIPDGGGLMDGIKFLRGDLTKSARKAQEWVDEAIATVKTAPDNPFGDDEAIAGEILRQIECSTDVKH
jgi:hypothetical protein